MNTNKLLKISVISLCTILILLTGLYFHNIDKQNTYNTAYSEGNTNGYNVGFEYGTINGELNVLKSMNNNYTSYQQDELIDLNEYIHYKYKKYEFLNYTNTSYEFDNETLNYYDLSENEQKWVFNTIVYDDGYINLQNTYSDNATKYLISVMKTM